LPDWPVEQKEEDVTAVGDVDPGLHERLDLHRSFGSLESGSGRFSGAGRAQPASQTPSGVSDVTRGPCRTSWMTWGNRLMVESGRREAAWQDRGPPAFQRRADCRPPLPDARQARLASNLALVVLVEERRLVEGQRSVIGLSGCRAVVA
jgi:hypothetical protein